MSTEITVALINAAALILSATIGVAGVWAILKHRKKIIELSTQVEAYYHHESQLVREIYRANHNGQEASPQQLAHFRGKLRKRLLSNDQEKPRMNATQAQNLRKQLL